MSQTWVTNLTHFLDEKGAIPDALPKPARELAENLANLVANATIEPQLGPRANVTCWSTLGKKPCHGRIEAEVSFDLANILWYCIECGEDGAISQWENSFWDCGFR